MAAECGFAAQHSNDHVAGGNLQDKRHITPEPWEMVQIASSPRDVSRNTQPRRN
jgi:hypothetical protein